jgi:hypothetical protein
MPIDSTTADAREVGDIGKRGTGNPALIERLLGSFENLAAGSLRFLFGTSDHGSKTSMKMPHAASMGNVGVTRAMLNDARPAIYKQP